MPVRVRVRACCNGHYDRAGGIDEGADGVTIFFLLGHHETGTGGKLFNGIKVALPGALSPYLEPLGLMLGFS
jgi:hypothetical protein